MESERKKIAVDIFNKFISDSVDTRSDGLNLVSF